MKTAIWWMRRDLRLSDNQALSAALAQAERVVPVYLLDSDSLDRLDVNQKRLAFLLGGLRILDEDLRLRGSRLIVRSGDPKDELETLLAETGANAIRAAFHAWSEGRTGFPLVDAAMRQLVQTGWLHNRARLVVASFLTKDLLVDWQWGERFFAQHLLDGDLAANNEGWQRAAGTGTGAAAYLDILNPSLQGRKYDPEGAFVRRWVPELTRVPTPYIHQPWLMPADVQRELACVIGQDYPAPILDHGWARERAMEFFRNARKPIKTY